MDPVAQLARWLSPGGTVQAGICPALPGQPRDFLGFFAAPEGFKSPSSDCSVRTGHALPAGRQIHLELTVVREVSGAFNDLITTAILGQFSLFCPRPIRDTP